MAGTAELNQVTTPAAGVLAWGYGTYTYPGGESYREVQSRQMTSGNTLSPWTNSWAITRSVSSTLNLHPSTTVADAEHRHVQGLEFPDRFRPVLRPGDQLRGAEWVRHGAPSQGLYVVAGPRKQCLHRRHCHHSRSRPELPGDNHNPADLDIYGNTTQTKLYDYGNPATPARTYNYTYLNSSWYLNAYIRNRLAQASVTDSHGTVTLETDSYDGSSLTDRTGITAHDSAYSMYYGLRGNRTTTVQPGSTRNVHYDIGGMPVSADDGHYHSVTITPAPNTNFAAPGAILPNGNSTYTSTYTYTPALQPVQRHRPQQQQDHHQRLRFLRPAV